MKLTEELIVLRDRETGAYLNELHNKEYSLATKASFTKDIRGALTVTYDSYLRQKQQFKAMAAIHNCEIIRVKAEYSLTYPNGTDAPEIEYEEKASSIFDLFKQL